MKLSNDQVRILISKIDVLSDKMDKDIKRGDIWAANWCVSEIERITDILDKGSL